MKNNIRILALSFLLPIWLVPVQASASPNRELSVALSDTAEWSAPLPFDSGVKVGTLDNGLRYYIRKNVEPKARVTMFLANKVGSILETEEQLGLAHFLEHMNFNGLKHFPKNELVNYLQKAGVRFGSDLNAYTGFDQTVYQLPIPSDDPELLKNGLQVMRDWAQDALLTDEEIDKERGVVLEEMRGGRGSGQRMQDQYMPVLLNNSLYSRRMPIGTEELISNFPYKELRQFHSDWYRPDLQAVIIVGDIDVAQMESEVKRLFSDLKSPQHPKPRVEHKIPLLHTNQFIAVTDPEMTSTQAQIIIKHPKRELKTLGDYRDALLKNLYSRMINSRLSELAQQANPPFLGASVAVGGFMAGLDSYTASVSVKSGELEGGFKAMLRELERAHQHGFLESEFQRAISVLNKSNEAGYVERDKRESAGYVKGYLAHFLNDAPALSSEDSYRLTKQLLPGLTLAEVEAIGTKYYVDTNRDIVVLAPEKDKPSLPNEQLAGAWFKTVEGEQLAAYVDNTSDLPMLAVQPRAGSVVSSKTLEDIEAKELTLSNAVKVILKPTTFKNDQIILNAFSPGGTSLVSDEDFYSATHAGVLVNMSGVGQMNSVELQKFMTGKRFNIQPYIGERSEGLSGSSDKEGLPLMFEMLHAYFTAPRIDKDVFDNAISNAIAQMANRDSDPNFTFSKAVMALTYNNHLRRTPVEPEDMKKIDREHTLAIYKERFADASDFVFTIVGSFTEAEITPYLEQYVASLPSLARAEEAKDLGIYETDKGVEHKVYKGKEPKAYVSMAYYGDFTYNDQEVMNLNALQSVLNVKLLEQLREEEGGTYGVGARVTTTKYPKGRFGLTITFGTGVEKYEALSKSAMDVLHKVVNEGPSQEDLDKFKIEQRRQIELAFKENGFWLGQISSSYQQYEDPAYVVNQLDRDLDSLTVESVQAVAKKYLKDEKIVKSVLLPE